MYYFSIMWVLYILLLSPFLLLFSYQRKFYHLHKKFAVAKGLPIVGVAHRFQRIQDCFSNGEELVKQYGRNVLLYVFCMPYLVLTNVREVEFVLSSQKLIDKSDEYKFSQEWFGTGLLTSTGQKWKSHRKILTPSFHYKILEEFVHVFDQKSFELVNNLRNCVGKDYFDVQKPISLFTMDVICETAMGTKVNAQKNPDLPYIVSIHRITDVFYKRSVTHLRNKFLFYLSRAYTVQQECLKVLLDFSRSIIQKRRHVLNSEIVTSVADNVGLKKKCTFLDALLTANIDGKPLGDEEIREEVDTFIFEGHDTTAMALSYCLYLLGKNIDVQEIAYKEIRSILGDDKQTNITYSDLQNMRYLEQVVKESLRLYPSVFIFTRKVVEDTEYDGTVLPKGLTIILSPYAMHRDPEIYPDPLKFDPKRFTKEEQAKRHPFAYIPFSAGPRNCIGQKFAMLELKCTIAKVLRNFKVLPAPPEKDVFLVPGITLQSHTGINIRLEERQ